MTPLVSSDHNQYQEVENNIGNHLRNNLTKNGYSVLRMDISTDITSWDKSQVNKSFVLLLFTDIVWDRSFINDLEKLAIEFNNKFTLITDNIPVSNFISNFRSKHIKILFIKEFYGVYYNSSVTPLNKTSYKKLYSCLIQRTDHFRLLLFNKLIENKLIDSGYVSCLGWQTDAFLSKHNIKTHHDVFNLLISQNPEMFSINISDVPYKNFKEPDSLYTIEKLAKFSIVYETYNSSNEADNDFVLFTEKSLRSLQIGNIPLILNSNHTSQLLKTKLNLKSHPINSILDKMPDRYSQIEFIIGVLCNNDFIDDSMIYDYAIHNRRVLREYNDVLHSTAFYENILYEII